MKSAIAIAILFAAAATSEQAARAGTPMKKQAADQPDLILQAAMDEAFAELLKPGQKQEGWNRGGTDVRGEIMRLPGGSRNNVLWETDKDGGTNVTVMNAGKTSSYIPKRWKLIKRAGSTADLSQAPSELSIGRLDGRFFLVLRQPAARLVGGAYCSSGQGASELYEDEADRTSSEIPPEMVPMIFQLTTDRLLSKTLCWRYDREGDSYRTSYFLEDGRSLPALDQGSKARIVPAQDIEKLIQPASKR